MKMEEIRDALGWALANLRDEPDPTLYITASKYFLARREAAEIVLRTLELRDVIDEGQRQMIILALAELALSRPGWDDSLRSLANLFFGEQMFDGFKKSNADRVKAERGPMGPR